MVVLASADSDLVPALQLVAGRFPEKAIVTAAWAPEPPFECPAPLDLSRGELQRVRIPKRDFDRIAGKRNFYEPAADMPGSVDPSRWQRIRNRYGRRP